jgi:putative DNA primase/helicase
MTVLNTPSIDQHHPDQAEIDPGHDVSNSPRLPPLSPHVRSEGLADAATLIAETRQRRRNGIRSKPPDLVELTDEGNARRFVELHGDSIRYCSSWGWIFYDGQQWRVADTIAIERKGRDTFQWLSDQSRRIKGSLDRLKYQAALKGFRSATALKGMLSLARSDAKVGVTPGDFDRDPFLLNCRNGTISLRTGELGPHDPSDYLSKSAAVDFVPEATCPQWDDFLLKVTGEDAEMIGYLRRAVGYSLTGNIGEQCLFLLYGNGSNGKSVFLDSILKILGDYGMKAQSHLLTSEGRSKHATSITDLDGRRFVAISEPSGGRFDEAQVKALIGDATIRANRMHKDSYQFTATHKFFMASNHKPVVAEVGMAFWRRMRLIEFNVTIPPEKQDHRLLAKLQEEASGILNWMVQGCLEWQKNPAGLAVPEQILQSTNDYRDEMDPLSGFISACCEVGSGYQVPSSNLWAAYIRWCDDQGISQGDRIANITQFGKLFGQKGYTTKKTGGGTMHRVGIKLKSPPPPR